MNSLTSIEEILKKWDGLKNCLNLISSSRDYPLDIEGVQGSFFSFLVKEICKTSHFKSLQASQYQNSSKSAPAYEFISSDMLLVLPSEKDAIEISQDLQTICPDYEIYTFPGTGTVPYRPMAKGSVVFGQRAGVLSNLIYSKQQITFNSKARIFIFTQRSFLSFLPPPSYLKDLSFELKKDDLFDTVEIAKKLSQIGYTRVPKVNVRGEFSLRGEVLDIFLPNDQNAIRIVFDFDQIKELKYFDVSDQVTINSLSKIIIYPCKEVIWNDELVSKLEDKLNEYDKNGIEESINPSGPEADVHLKFTQKALEFKENLINQLRTCGEAEGEELFYNLLWDKQYTILDYISQNSYILFYDYNRLVNGQLTIEREYNGMYRRAREELCVLPPSKILNNFDQLQKAHEKSILFKSISTELSENSKAIKLETDPSRSFFGNINFMKDELTKLQKDNWNIFIFTDNENQKLRINEIFKDFTNPDLENPVTLIPDKLSSGFSVPELKLIVIQENEIFGRRKYVSKTVNKARSSVIDTFVELNPGDYVVHVNWGIGKFLGIERVKSLGNERDYIKLQYADEEFAFVPIEQVNLVQRYIGNEGENPRLDRIGSKSWESRKNKVREAVEELAQKLIDLYSRRKASVGYAFPKETEWQAAFEAAFPYEDTPDQILVTEQIKEDMEKPVPMDRLVCGDVGYGKTEIAMRAAFKAVMGGKQVAFLAPTTILAEQHYDNCKERFKNFPVKIERMSRFVSPAEQKKILAKTAAGEVDILVGTHRIIQKDVKFKNLGLMIIDEEQRFGVKDKEKLKVMKNNIDCLTMSATPIPRLY